MPATLPIRIQNVGGVLRCDDLTPVERNLKLDIFRQADIASIRRFMEANQVLLTGEVLDFGAGKPGTCREPEPYRYLVAGEYTAFEKGDELPIMDGDSIKQFDVIMCNQVLEYVSSPSTIVAIFRMHLKHRGTLLITYKTNWEECEDADHWRITKAGMEAILTKHGFEVIEHQRRAEIVLDGRFTIATGYGVIARSV